ncbi:DUF6090 family protein [Psychroserpens burtonensis]|nr:DUF6090 family protein [Psychroserpens burtonensis]
METGKTGKPALPAGRYFKYAIGEIILVVIGILIALAINNWNQNRIKIVQERDDLENLKEEIQTNIVDFKSLDSLYATFEKKTAYGLKLFNDNPNVEDFIQIDTLIVTQLKVFPLTSSTYDEMLNTGKFYNLKNKTLKTKITRFYAEANNYSLAFIQINNSVINIANLPDLFRYGLLRDRLKTKPIHIKDIDTTWVHNVNAPTYLAFYKSANYIQGFSNTSRRELMARQILVCKELVKLIDSELERKI